MQKQIDVEYLDSLVCRYNSDDPTLTPEETTILRQNVAILTWMDMQKARIKREEDAKVVPITAGRNEQDIAQELRADLQARLETIGEIMTKARREHGLIIAFQFSLPDAFGRQSLAVLEITKKLC